VDSVYQFIEEAPKTLGTDPDRVYMLGFSQGATITWASLLCRWPRPKFIAGAVVLSGRLMPELLQPATPLGGRCAPTEQLADVPLLVTHGSDDMVTPSAIGQESRRSFEQWRGAPPLDFRELKGDGHEISGQCQAAVREFLHRHL
jgi:phospholipase/carboxylesterase